MFGQLLQQGGATVRGVHHSRSRPVGTALVCASCLLTAMRTVTGLSTTAGTLSSCGQTQGQLVWQP
jgi:hypothetical protein